MKRRIMAALLAAAMLLSVAACSSGGESSAGGEAQESTGGAAGTTESTAGEGAADGDTGLTYDGEEVTITYWHTHGDAEEVVLKEQIVPEFEKQFPNIHVKLVRMPYDGLKQQVIQGVSSGTAPDLMRMDIIWVTEFAKLGALVPVDDLPGFAEMKETLFEGPLSTNYYEGKYYGLPLNTNCLSGAWSKTMLDQLGLTEVPKTYDDMLALKDQLKEGQYLFATEDTNTWATAPLFYSLGGTYTNEDYTKASGYLNGEASVKALETIVQWYDEGILGPATMAGKPDVSKRCFPRRISPDVSGPVVLHEQQGGGHRQGAGRPASGGRRRFDDGCRRRGPLHVHERQESGGRVGIRALPDGRVCPKGTGAGRRPPDPDREGVCEF